MDATSCTRHGSPDAPRHPPNDTPGHIYVVDLATRHDGARRPRRRRHSRHRRSVHADINGDGTRVAFESIGDQPRRRRPGSPQLYVRDLVKNTTTWASVPQDANPMHADPGDPSLSRDGTRVAFEQFSPQFGFGMTGSGQVFVRDLDRGDDDAGEPHARRRGRRRGRAAVAERGRQPRQLHDELRQLPG